MYRKTGKTKKPEDYNEALGYALFLLGLRARSKGEMIFKMEQRGFSNDVINKVVEELFRLKYLNDELFAYNLVENYKKYKNYGFMKVKLKLMEKKFDKQIIDLTLEENFRIDDEMRVLKRIIDRLKLNELKKDPNLKVKLIRSFSAKGFRMNAILEALQIHFS